VLKALICPRVNRLTGQAVFGISNPSKDAAAKAIIDKLGVLIVQ
jgi:hypothetical protein